jgi:hypothetical protein
MTDIRRGDLRFVKRIKSPTFPDFAKGYQAWSRQNKRSWTRDQCILTHLLHFFGTRRLSELHSFDAERYKASRVEVGTSKGTVDRELACLRHTLNLAVKWGKLKRNHVCWQLLPCL